jgi:heptaprenyl diphosphate synthase
VVDGSDLFSFPLSERDLARLEACLRESVTAGDEFLDEVASHLIAAGGKRLRSSLALTASELGGGPISKESLLGGVCVELVHLASLYHDDVMDEAQRRRGVQSVNARWGNLVAIVAGDFLLARSAEIAAGLGPEVAGLLAATLGKLCQGQVKEVRRAYSLERGEAEYLNGIAHKTAALMATSCQIGGLTAGLGQVEINELAAFGHAFGMAFQIRDDVLDVIATEEELGKAPGQDLAEGIYTLPVQLALLDVSVAGQLRQMLGRKLGDEDRMVARCLVAASSGVIGSSAVASQYAERAAQAAERLDGGPISERLVRLAVDVGDDLRRSAELAKERFALAG